VDTAGTPNKIRRIRRDGVGQTETIVEGLVYPVDLSAEGDLLYMEEGAEQDSLKLLSPGDEESARTVVTGELGKAVISPDGTMIAYVDGTVEPEQIYAVRTDGSGLRVQISTSGGANPRWASDGKELFYFTPADRLMSVTIRGEGERIIASEPTELFKTKTSRWNEFYDVTPDGQRFLVVLPVAEPTPRPIHVFVNWAPELFGGDSPGRDEPGERE